MDAVSPSCEAATLEQLDRIASQFVPSILRLDLSVDRVLDRLLAQIGEATGTTYVAFTAFQNPLGNGLSRSWTQAGGGVTGGHGDTLPVTVGGRRVAILTIGPRADSDSIHPDIEDRLRRLSDLMALAVQFGEQTRAIERMKAKAHGSQPVEIDEINEAGDFEDIIGDSPALRVAIARVLEVAPTDASVVLFGETGTGKELFARAVHNRSRRRGRPFVRVNCAALPPTLIETELFGHERGAFTGAVAMRRGRFELAHNGTLFLDEIGDLPAEVQAKLLRVLQEGEFERVGSSEPHAVDVRVVAATHHDLEAAVKEGRFRADLFYRLSVFPIALPPLRERAEDIPRLVWFFINRRQRALNRKFTSIPSSVMSTLQQHAWPGNVRELENVVERAMIHSTGDTLLLDEGQEPRVWRPTIETGTLEAVDRQHIERALRRCGWRINGPGNAAEVLGLHPNTLRFRMKKLGIQRPKSLVVVDVGQRSA